MLWVIFFAAIASATELQKQNARLLRTNKILLQTLQKISSETAVGMGQNAQVSGSKPKCEDISIMDGYLTCGGLNEMFNGDICKYDYGAPGAPCSCMCGSDFICEGKACGECLDNTDYACTFYDGKCISSESMKDPSGFKMSKFVWNSDNCPTEKSVGFNPFASKCSKRNDCIYDCQEADSSKTKYDCMKECPKSLCEEKTAECSTASDCESPYTDCWMGTCVTEINVGDELCTCTGRYTGWVAGGEACQFGTNCAPRSRCSNTNGKPCVFEA
eukprot:UN22387